MDDSLAQAIVVFEDEDATYKSIMETVAFSSMKCEFSEDKYTSWVKSGQRKTVRRANEKLFKKIVEELHESSLKSFMVDGEVKAIAFEPIFYSEFPKNLRRAQVSGFKTLFEDIEVVKDFEKIEKDSFIVDSSLEMPVGKAAVQYAHAFHIFQEKFKKDIEEAHLVFATHEVFEKAKEECLFKVTDSGLTVFEGPTDTICYI